MEFLAWHTNTDHPEIKLQELFSGESFPCHFEFLTILTFHTGLAGGKYRNDMNDVNCNIVDTSAKRTPLSPKLQSQNSTKMSAFWPYWISGQT
jgi:hypothetical protein